MRRKPLTAQWRFTTRKDQRWLSLAGVLVALAGGVGAARLLSGLIQAMDPADLVAVVNTGDDFGLHGLHISPDIDTVIYTLAGAANPETGWGLDGETWRVMGALERLGGETWFRLGDSDLATHLYRTHRLAQGAALSKVTAELAQSWGLCLSVLPMSDDPVRTMLSVRRAGIQSANDEEVKEISFQDYFVRLAHSVPVKEVRFSGAASARPAPGVVDALRRADQIVICPSNPILSIGPILALREIRELLQQRRPHVVAVSPIVAGAALKGPADHLLRELGLESSVVGIARSYAEVAATLVIDETDRGQADLVEAAGMRSFVAPTVMSTPERARHLAEQVVSAGVHR